MAKVKLFHPFLTGVYVNVEDTKADSWTASGWVADAPDPNYVDYAVVHAVEVGAGYELRAAFDDGAERTIPTGSVDSVVKAQKALFLYQDTEPTSSTYTAADGTTWPIVWVAPGTTEPVTTSVTATAPTFDDGTDTYTIPTTTGVDYLVGSTVTAAGTYSVTAPATVTITAQAQSGYTLTGTTEWSFSFTTAASSADVYESFTHADGTMVAGWASDGTVQGSITSEIGGITFEPIDQAAFGAMTDNHDLVISGGAAVQGGASWPGGAMLTLAVTDVRVGVDYTLTTGESGYATLIAGAAQGAYNTSTNIDTLVARVFESEGALKVYKTGAIQVGSNIVAPRTGRLELEYRSTGAFAVYLDGVEKATGTVHASTNTRVGLQVAKGSLDNFEVTYL